MENKQQLPEWLHLEIIDKAKRFAFYNYVSTAHNPEADWDNMDTWPDYAVVAYHTLVNFHIKHTTHMPDGNPSYAALWQESERKRKEAMELLDPILEWGQSKEADMKLGESITKAVLERATLWQQAEAEKKQLRDVLKYIREVIRFEFNTEDIIAFINDKLTQLPSEGDAFEEEKPEGPWDVKYMGSVSSTEAGTEYDDWIEITDGKVTLYLDGGLEDNDEQLLVNFLNARKIKLDYDHESELAAHLLEQELKRANRVVQAQEEYIELLVKEIESMVAIAYVHGWRSDNHEKGARVREKIAALKEGRKEVENG